MPKSFNLLIAALVEIDSNLKSSITTALLCANNVNAEINALKRTFLLTLSL